VRGIMLFGPPGCGKTLMARQIGKMLNCHEPKIINGPEILNKYVGQSEENIRVLFSEAEQEWEEKKEASQLHLLIFDEIDAICKQRGTSRSGTGVNDSVVNQLLSKIDGVNSLNNVLLIGMTNRLDLIDEALLRPGRFEVQVEIGLPDRKGRLQILKIHTEKMRKNKYMADDVNFEVLADATKNFSGAEIEGLVKSATSFALNRTVDLDNIGMPQQQQQQQKQPAAKAQQPQADNKSKIEKDVQIKVTMADFELALQEVKPAFGISTDELEPYLAHGLIDYGQSFTQLLGKCKSFVQQISNSDTTDLLTVLLEGVAGTGKTTLSAHLAVHSGFPYVKIISPETMVGYGEVEKAAKITKVFHDAYKSPLSIIVLDNIERLIEFVHIGPRFSNLILQTMLVLLKKVPGKKRKLMVIGTTSQKDTLKNLEISEAFNFTMRVPQLTRKDIQQVLLTTEAVEPTSVDKPEFKKLVDAMPERIGIKKLLMVTEMARAHQDKDKALNVEDVQHALMATGLSSSYDDEDDDDLDLEGMKNQLAQASKFSNKADEDDAPAQ